MKRFLAALSLLLVTFPALAADLTHYQPGYRTIDGSQLNKMVDAVNTINSGQAIFSGEIALDGSNPTPVTTGLTTIAGCDVVIKSTSAPSTTTVVSYGSSGGTLNIYGWKPNTITDNTLVASTGTDTVGWTCGGTK